MIERGQGEPEAFILGPTFVTCLYQGGYRSNGKVGTERKGIQSGITNVFNELIELKRLAK